MTSSKHEQKPRVMQTQCWEAEASPFNLFGSKVGLPCVLLDLSIAGVGAGEEGHRANRPGALPDAASLPVEKELCFVKPSVCETGARTRAAAGGKRERRQGVLKGYCKQQKGHLLR